MFQLKWSIEGEQQLSRVLKNIGSEVKDWEPAFKEASEELKTIFANDVFETRGGEIGEKWPPLKPQYLARKAAGGFPTDPLVKTGKMKNSFQNLYKADYAEVWNSVEYFKYHQSNKPRRVLPRRVMMKLGENQKQLVVKVFHTHWQKKVKNAVR